MRITKRIRSPDGSRELLGIVARSGGVLTLRAERILPMPERPGEDALQIDLTHPIDSDRVRLQIYGAKARGLLHAAEADEFIEIAETIRAALLAQAVDADPVRAERLHRRCGR